MRPSMVARPLERLSSVNPDTVTVARRPGLIEALVDGELIGLHVDNGLCYGFNDTATRIWVLIEQPATLGAICAALTREFAVDPETCAREVMDLVDSLHRDGLVEVRSGVPAARPSV